MLNIVSCFSQLYLQHFLVMAKSVEVNTPQTNITFHVLYRELEEKDIAKIKYEFKNSSYINFKFYLTDLTVLEGLNLKLDYLSYETLSRLILTEILPSTLNRIMYIDSDVVVRRNLNYIYNTDLELSLVGAVLDMNPYHSEKYKKQIAYTEYFNAGVLLIELERWRDLDLADKLITSALINAEVLEFADQDVLNMILGNKCKILDLEWNVNRNFYDYNDFPSIEYDKLQLENAKKDPAIIHFTGRSKPWFFLDAHPFKYEYSKYLNMLKSPIRLYKEKLFIESKKVILFGTGQKAAEDYNTLKYFNVTVKCFFDNNKKKWGQTLYGVNILEPKLEVCDFSNDIVVVSSQYYEEIGNQLQQLGLQKNKHYFEDIISIGMYFN